MRLTCPNCDAQYEVPEDVMPPEGRDVQCSNCGQTWFQDHPDTMAARQDAPDDTVHEDEEVIRAEPESFDGELGPELDEEISRDNEDPVADVPTLEPDPTPDSEPDLAPEDEPELEPESTAPPRRSLDPAVTDVLREEAELEAQARRNEGGSMESQPDLGLDDAIDDSAAAKRAQEAKDRMARIRGETSALASSTDTGNSDSTPMSSRRTLLPDIEEINSTLRSNNDRSPNSDPGQTAQIEVQEKRSSRRGFVLTIALVAVLSLIYVYAPQLAEAVPQAENALTTYVTMVDGWRVWLDEQVSAMLSWLDEAAVSSSQ